MFDLSSLPWIARKKSLLQLSFRFLKPLGWYSETTRTVLALHCYRVHCNVLYPFSPASLLFKILSRTQVHCNRFKSLWKQASKPVPFTAKTSTNCKAFGRFYPDNKIARLAFLICVYVLCTIFHSMLPNPEKAYRIESMNRSA